MSDRCRRSKRSKRATDFLTYEDDDGVEEQQPPKKALKANNATMKKVPPLETRVEVLQTLSGNVSVSTKNKAKTAVAKGVRMLSPPVKTNSKTTAPSKLNSHSNDNLDKPTNIAPTTSKKTDPVARDDPTTVAKIKPTAAPFAAAIANIPAPGYASDEEPPEKDPKDFLDWRSDPELTFSDWTIQIVSGSGSIDTYHVHKVMLSYGYRNQNESGYFLNLFCRGDRYPESSSNTSRIELHELAAKAFPLLLDYVYASGGKESLDASTETASALYFLGSYFDMRRLRWDAKQFWKKDISLENAVSYYEHARVFHEEKIMDSVADLLAENILEIETSSEIMDVSDSYLWMSILKKLQAKEELQLHLGQLIANFVMKNVDDLDVDTFRSLTAPGMLPTVSTKDALTLLQVELKIDPKSPSLLEDRCAAAMADNWSDISNMLRTDNSVFKKKAVRRSFFIKLLEKSLDNATGDIEIVKEEKKASENKLEKTNRELKDQKAQTERYTGLFSTVYDAKQQLQAQLDSAQIEIVKLRSLVPSYAR